MGRTRARRRLADACESGTDRGNTPDIRVPVSPKARLAFAVLVLVLALSRGVRWWRHPTVFMAAAPIVSTGGVAPAGGPPLHVGMTWFPQPRPGEPVTLLAASPHILLNTAGARITFHVCVMAKRGSIGSIRGDLSRYCSQLLPLKNTRFPVTYDFPRRHVLMTVTTTKPGAVRIQGMHLSYRYGHQSGSQLVGEYVYERYN